MLRGGVPIRSIRYGKTSLPIVLPDRTDIVSYRDEPHPDPAGCIAETVTAPIGTKPLAELAAGRSNAVILISDSTRLCPSYLFLETLIDELNRGGIPDRLITVVVALGLHRLHTEQELERLAGSGAFRRVRVVNHSSLPEHCTHLGVTSSGTPVEINSIVASADLRIATGNIEPHALVGISGGVKALVPGVASRACIEHNHALSLKYKAASGSPDNPIHRDLEEAHRFAPIHFILNVIVNHDRKLMNAVAGHITEAHRRGVALAASHFLVPVNKQYDVAIVSAGGYPKDSQLYQSIKSLKNAASLTKPGGTLLLAAECGEMFGNGLLQYWLETMPSRADMVNKLRAEFVLGAHKVLHIDELLQQHNVHLYTEMPEAMTTLTGFTPEPDLQAAVNRLTDNKETVAFLPYGAITFPVLPG